VADDKIETLAKLLRDAENFASANTEGSAVPEKHKWNDLPERGREWRRNEARYLLENVDKAKKILK
jgi:hypothetical protein